MLVLYAALGGGVGAALRFIVSSKITHHMGAVFPYGTMVVNVVGSFLMGALVEWLVKTLPHSHELRTFLAVGVLGGFTTFSAFSLDTVGLYDQGSVVALSAYVVGSVLLAVIALLTGVWLMRSIIA